MTDILNLLLKRPKQTLIGALVCAAVYVGFTFWILQDMNRVKPELVSYIRNQMLVKIADTELHTSQPNYQPTGTDYDNVGKDAEPYKELQVDSITVRGLGTTVVAKVKVSLGGKPLPQGQDVHYFELRYYLLSGWRIRREVGVDYYDTTWLARFEH